MNYELVGLSVFVVVGILQFIKNFVSLPPQIWAIVMAILAFAAGAGMEMMPTWARMGMLAVAASQVGYESIIQLVKSKIEKA